MPHFLHRQNQSLVDAHTETLQKVIEEYDKKVREAMYQYSSCQGSTGAVLVMLGPR